jgi:hypothetical protein
MGRLAIDCIYVVYTCTDKYNNNAVYFISTQQVFLQLYLSVHIYMCTQQVFLQLYLSVHIYMCTQQVFLQLYLSVHIYINFF